MTYCRAGNLRGHDIFAGRDLKADNLLYFLSKKIIKIVFADMIFPRILRILTKARKYNVREYDFNDLFTKKV